MSTLALAVCRSAAAALFAALAFGCGDDTGTGAGSQGGSPEGGAPAGGAEQGGAGGDSACADAGGFEAPPGATDSEITCADVCNQYAKVTCQLSCTETVDCVEACLAYVDMTGPTAECEQARLTLFQCFAEESTNQTCSCSGAEGTIACQACAEEKGALALCK